MATVEMERVVASLVEVVSMAKAAGRAGRRAVGMVAGKVAGTVVWRAEKAGWWVATTAVPQVA